MDLIDSLRTQITTERLLHPSGPDLAERMGYDAGRNAPNTTNCHFSLFATPELTRAWERGKARGDAEREAKNAS